MNNRFIVLFFALPVAVNVVIPIGLLFLLKGHFTIVELVEVIGFGFCIGFGDAQTVFFTLVFAGDETKI